MSRVPGLQYPAHLVESNPTDASLKVVFDNLFYLRRAIESISSNSTLTQQQIRQLVTEVINNTVINLTATSFQVGTHAVRLTTTPILGAAFLETDRIAIYIGSDASGTTKWVWSAGNMVAAIASIPTDLVAADIGFLFTESDSSAQTQFFWDGTKFITIGGLLQEVADAVTNTLTTLVLRRHSTSGAATTGFGSTVLDQLEDSAGVAQTAAFESIEWTSGATNNVLKRWWLRIAGTLTSMLELAVSGLTLLTGDYVWKSGTAFFGTLRHANTGSRNWDFPDADGAVVYENGGLTNNNFALGGGGALVKDAGYTQIPVAAGGTGSNTAAGARGNLSAAAIQAVGGSGAGTYTIAKITALGLDGSITITAEGTISSFTAPT